MGKNMRDLKITYIKGGTDNCYLVSDGKAAFLVDTSSGKSLPKVLEECSKYDMKLIVLTHPHFDHAENAADIAKKFHIPVAYHQADDEIFDNYESQPLKSYGAVGFVVLKLSLKQLSQTKVARPDDTFFVKEGDTLEAFGFPEAKILELPGHTRGSIGVLVSDSELIVGDALDNWIRPGVGHLYYDLDVQRRTAQRIRDLHASKIYYGHGKPTNGF